MQQGGFTEAHALEVARRFAFADCFDCEGKGIVDADIGDSEVGPVPHIEPCACSWDVAYEFAVKVGLVARDDFEFEGAR